ncbi:helicase [Myxozyma melibiosi]|uniref:RNA helicase n=1 Tax=Myxozyma melibiosi TaxID=54550 RepID=A0ABR1F7I6_9ASCO
MSRFSGVEFAPASSKRDEDDIDSSDDDLDDSLYTGLRTASVSPEFKRASVKMQREMLPIFAHRESLLYLIESSQVVVLIGHTGSGKSTQMTQYLYEAGWTDHDKLIACTQPRKLAASSVAARVATEIGCRLGETVGYSIRFEDVTSPETRIKYMTDGMLLREILIDPLLSRYSVIMIDEAHERSTYTDILICVLKKIIKRRRDLRVIISSATLQADEFVNFFGSGTKIISIEGRMHPVDLLYLTEPTENYVEKTIETIFSIHANEPAGDILAFLTGREEITQVIQAIYDRQDTLPASAPRLLILPLYAGLSQEHQQRIFDPTPDGTRKIIISTNIAEASVTIDGIVYVIDCGFVKLRAYDPELKMDSLVVTPASKASATQRAGRAGRTRNGKCFRLYTEAAYDQLAETTPPELQRTNLAGPLLQLKALGIDNLARLDMLSPPPVELVVDALELLFNLGALDDYAKLTKPLGERLAELPLDPMLGKILLQAQNFGCVNQMLTIAAMMSVDNIFYYPENNRRAAQEQHAKFIVAEGDLLSYFNVYQAFTLRGKQSSKWAHERFLNYKALVQAVSIRAQLARYLTKLGVSIPSSAAAVSPETVVKCIVSGYFPNAAKMQPDGSLRLLSGDNGSSSSSTDGKSTVWIHPTSVMFSRSAEWVVFSQIVKMGKKTYINGVTKIDRDWLLEAAPRFYQVTKQR